MERGGSHPLPLTILVYCCCHQMVDPQYQELLKKDIPHVSKDGVHVAVIAGSSYRASVSQPVLPIVIQVFLSLATSYYLLCVHMYVVPAVSSAYTHTYHVPGLQAGPRSSHDPACH